MKIFAKRKKATVKPEESAGEKKSTPQKTFASDPVVEELLKKDPIEWNAKEKRMVKRYQKRKEEAGGNDNDADKKKEQPDNDTPEQENETAPKNTKEESKELELGDVLEDSVFDSLNSKQRRKLSRTLSQKGKDAIKEVIQEANLIVEGENSKKNREDKPRENNYGKTKSENSSKKAFENASTEKDEMAKVEGLLQGLNSKQKRTLSRRLQREGQSCLAEVRAEAEALLKGSAEESADKEPTNESKATTGKKRKRRGGSADLSGLTPEERLRREEQRKMQKEAAERRATGEDDTSKFKHPLNSERRRANRRKPKWMSRKDLANPDKIEHNASGFQARKRVKHSM